MTGNPAETAGIETDAAGLRRGGKKITRDSRGNENALFRNDTAVVSPLQRVQHLLTEFCSYTRTETLQL